MKLIPCPDIGRRPISEFDYGGEVRRLPAGNATAAMVADHIFNRSGSPGVLREWWFHRPSGRWFVVDRDTLHDRVERMVPLDEIRHEPPIA